MTTKRYVTVSGTLGFENGSGNTVLEPSAGLCEPLTEYRNGEYYISKVTASATVRVDEVYVRISSHLLIARLVNFDQNNPLVFTDLGEDINLSLNIAVNVTPEIFLDLSTIEINQVLWDTATESATYYAPTLTSGGIKVTFELTPTGLLI